ncbi:pyridoxal 5'-phosphate synthase glutaminase subunit PdxT [Fibrobacter sp. UWEL]|uniref:pyridoxal 5'-phosphate synthase glutaminase subunit PdxT n=1 Tax=Fibrobacter sp. UWEL TaxID=1896209 RepID=UPI000911D3DF|nr:pyridoxal 5'-phosphate synthase glutaminase subunit PdxT [Fibrobacter sp. UWEL]SHK81955.1 pyridoxal phosphate synthase yaaE subunit [Fibrobacter sp. UWEL]
MNKPVIGVLAVQGAFIEHRQILAKLGVETFEIRQKADLLNNPLDGLILPGGESTVQGKLLRELDLFDLLLEKIQKGLPVFGTCAGLILLASRLSNDGNTYFGTLPVTVQRNAYGRQLGSFFTEQPFRGVNNSVVDQPETVPMTFIRAPLIESAGEGVDVLAQNSETKQIYAVRYKNQLGVSFHPELNDDTRIHQYFVDICLGKK